jgi:hypothetical protein
LQEVSARRANLENVLSKLQKSEINLIKQTSAAKDEMNEILEEEWLSRKKSEEESEKACKDCPPLQDGFQPRYFMKSKEFIPSWE